MKRRLIGRDKMLRLAITMLGGQIILLLALRPLILRYLGIHRAIKNLESIDLSLRCLPAVRNLRGERAAVRARAA
jgi:hypothetical protein